MIEVVQSFGPGSLSLTCSFQSLSRNHIATVFLTLICAMLYVYCLP